MVFQNIVDHYLSKILKDYIEDYSSDQFNLKLGIAELNNLRIKLNAINVLDLPFKLTHGFIGNLTLRVNFKNIYSTQLSLSIKDVYLVVVPNSSNKFNEKLELEKIRAYKNSQLERIEKTLQLMTNEVATQTIDTKDDSFVTKILLQIFNNVQIRIENVHIRLEDNFSNVKTPFAFGLNFSNLVFVTPDLKTEKSKFNLSNPSSGIFKIAMLSNFGLYFNCFQKDTYTDDFLSLSDKYNLINERMKKQIVTSDMDKPVISTDYVLEPINFHCKVFIHRKPHEDKFVIPTADIEMNLDKFALDFNRKQFETILVVIDNINRMSVAVAYRKWRPESDVKNNAQLWWQFAITCVLETNIRRKHRNWSWLHMSDHIIKRKKYKELYKKKLLSPDKTRENLENLIQNYEDKFDVLNITIARNQAKLECKDQLEALEKEKKRKVEEQKDAGWFSGWWSSSAKSPNETDGFSKDDLNKNKINLIEEVKKEFSDEMEKEKLYAAINYDETQKLDQNYPLGYAAQRLSFVIKSINLNITDKEQNVKISEFYLNEVKLALAVLPTSNGLDLALSINSMKMFGLRNKQVPIIEPILSKKSTNMIEVEFILNPIKAEIKHDFGVKVQAQGLKIIYDKETIDRLIEMMNVTREISLDEIQTLAALKLNEFQQRSLISLENAIENHKKLNLSLNIEPSFILVPETGSIDNAHNILLVSLGHFDIVSKLVDFNKNQLKEMMLKSPKEKLDLARHSAYENYLISISQFQLILSDKNNWAEDIDCTQNQKHQGENLKNKEHNTRKRHLVHPISLNLVLSRCIIMDDPELALMKLDAEIPEIQLIVEHKQILNLVKLLLSIVNVDELAEKEFKSKQDKDNEMKLERVQEEYQSNVIKAIAIEKQNKQQQILNQVKVQAKFSIDSLVIELKDKKNIILKGLIANLNSDFKMTNENMVVNLALDSIQFFCCMKYYYCINEMQSEIMQQINQEAPNAIKELQNYQQLNANQVAKKNKIKKDQPVGQNMLCSLIMTRVDFIMLDDFELANAPAVIFNMQIQMIFGQHSNETTLDLCLNKIQMAITEINQYLSDSKVELFILKPCDLICNVKIKNDNTQNISVMLEELALSISPNMVQILMSMLSKLGNSSPEIDDKDQQKVDVIVKANEFKSYRKLDENSWYMKLAKQNKSGNQSPDIELASEAVESLDLSPQSPSSEIEERTPRIVKQEFIFEIKTINFVIESGGVSSIPLVRFNSNLVTKFINYKELNLEMQMFMEYYNEKNFNWEPIIDIIDNKQWDFKVKIEKVSKKFTKDQESMEITFNSEDRLEITISNYALYIFKSLALSFSKAVNQPEILSKEEQKIIVKNSTEMTIFLYIDIKKLKCSETSVSKEKVDDSTNLIYLRSYSTLTLLPLTKDAIDADSILNYSFILWNKEFNRSLPLLSNNKSINIIYSNLYPGINPKYVINCTSKDKQTRKIHFYSNVVIHNYLKIPVGVYRFDQKNDLPEKVGDIKADTKLYLPINLVFSDDNQYVYIRPSDNYLLPVNALIWSFDELNNKKPNQKSYKTLICEPINKDKDQFIYIRLAHRLEKVRIENLDENEPFNFDYLHHFELYPQFKFRNLLPMELVYRTSCDQIDGGNLKSGEDSQIIDIKVKNSELLLDLKNYNNKSWYCLKSNFKWPKEDLTEVWEFVQSSSLTRDVFLLAVNFSEENGFRLLTIFAPFWMVNNTGLRLKYSLGDDLFITHEPIKDQVCLVCFKSKQLNEKKKMQLSLENSRFSDPFPVDVVGSKGSTMVKMHDSSLCFFTVDISLSEILFTKIVKFSAFYTIVSRISFDIEISENNIDWIKLTPKTIQSLFPRDHNQAHLFFRLPGSKIKPKKKISLKCTASTLLEVDDLMLCVNVEVTNHDAIIEIVNYYPGCSPALLVNCLDDAYLDFGQIRDGNRNRLPPLTMGYYNWEDPLGVRGLLWSTNHSNELECYLDREDDGKSLSGDIFWICFYDDNQRILLVTKDATLIPKIKDISKYQEYDQKINVYFSGLGVSFVDLNIMKEICYFSITSSDVVWECKKKGSNIFKSFVGKDIDALESSYKKFKMKRQADTDNNSLIDVEDKYEKIGNNLVVNFEKMKIVQPHVGLLKRTCLKGIDLALSKSEKLIQMHLKINKIQIDNQLDDHIFATILCPVPPPKSIRLDMTPKPFIELSTVIKLNNNRRHFKTLSFLIQEFAIQIDLDFVTAFQSYIEIVLKKTDTNYGELIKNSLEFSLRPEIDLERSTSNKHLYDALNLSPIKMHLSFSLGTIDTLNLPGILDYLVKSAGITLFEFKDAVLKINAFLRENALLTDDEFKMELIEHYKSAALSQFYMIVFGLDVIGNPVGLFLNLKGGFTDLFYEPITGIIQGPEEFIEGMRFGVKSFFSSTLGGVAGAMGKITGTLGEGISSLMEQSERKKRRERLNKNSGILQNSKNLAKGFFSGVTGLVRKPMEGAKREGFEGLMKGVGHGVVGFVAQPTTGIIDFTSGTLNQLQRTVNVSEEVKRIRPARALHVDGILRSYSIKEADGREMLKNLANKSSSLNNDIYISHCSTGKDRYFMITNKHLIFITKECLFKSYEVNWFLENANINKIENKDKILYFSLKKPKKALGLFGEKYVFELVCERIETAVAICNKLKQHIKTDWDF